MNSREFYQALLAHVLAHDASTEEVLAYMLVLHTHNILLATGVDLDDVKRPPAGGATMLSALTRTLNAEFVAQRYSGDAIRRGKDFWFTKFASETPFETLTDAPSELRLRALEAKKVLESHPMVAGLVED